MACRATVVLPDDSGPYTSIIRPRGYPPTPNAASSASEPLEDVAISKSVFSPSFMMEPLPKFFSICFRACSKAALRSLIHFPPSKTVHCFYLSLLYLFLRKHARKKRTFIRFFFKIKIWIVFLYPNSYVLLYFNIVLCSHVLLKVALNNGM